MNINNRIIQYISHALAEMGISDAPIVLETPPDSTMGDRSCTVALSLAKQLKRAPRQIAEELISKLQVDDALVTRVEIAGPGYLNFFFSAQCWYDLLGEILTVESAFGDAQSGAGKRHLFEFVSANPTGPMNVVSARAAALGNSLVKLQRKIGVTTHSEYYVNDSGRQIMLLGASVKARAAAFSGPKGDIPEGGYHGDYIIPLAQSAVKEFGQDLTEISDEDLGRWTAEKIREGQQKTLEAYGVTFDRWFRESELYKEGTHEVVLEELKQKGLLYEKDGATFIRTTDFGDDEDRVVVTSDGRYTYFLPDIAYHLDKARRGYNRAIDLLGPDHHGHGKRMQAALEAFDLGSDFLEVVIVQQVNLLRGGKPVKMSKRAGDIVSMKELIEEVGADAAKQIFLSRKWSSHLDFDIEVAKDRSDKSPVFYLQYAHARICSIFRKAGEREKATSKDYTHLVRSEEKAVLRTLSLFPEVVESAALQLAPHRLNAYLGDLATSFHHFYHECRVIGDDEELTRARLALCRAVQIVLKEGLRLLGMNAPERM